MLDIKFIRENQNLVKEAIRKKGIDFELDELIAVDEKRREGIKKLEDLKFIHNTQSSVIAGIKLSKIPSDDEPDHTEEVLFKQAREQKEESKDLEEQNNDTQEEFERLMLLIPQVPDPSVPEGKDDEDNKEIRAWGKKPKFGFDPKDYMELMEGLDLLDVERGAKVSGFRGYFLKNEAMLLSNALWQFALEKLMKKGFSPMMAPAIAREANFIGTGWLPQGKDEVYKIGDDEYLIGTSEVSAMGYHSGETMLEKDLPKTYAVFTPCFRSEVGSYGKDTKGIMRVHEFYKMEQVILCKADHEESVKWHEEITKNSEEIMQELELPHRVVINSTGDLGLGQVKKYDIETWLPSQNKYRETHSASYFHDFQTRRLNIRYRDHENKLQFAHSLNNTAMATPRILTMIVENYQTKEGTIKIPKALHKYMFGVKEIKLRNRTP